MLFIIVPDVSYVGLYAFSSCTGGSDLSQFSRVATVGSAVTFTDGFARGKDDKGRHHEAMLFSGQPSSNVTIPTSDNLDAKYQLTLMLKVRIRGAGTIFKFGSGFSLITTVKRADFELTLQSDSTGNDKDSYTIKADIWYFIGVTYDYLKGQAILYVDSKEKADFKLTTKTKLKTAEDIVIGENLMGEVSCLVIYDRTFGKRQIQNAEPCPIGML